MAQRRLGSSHPRTGLFTTAHIQCRGIARKHLRDNRLEALYGIARLDIHAQETSGDGCRDHIGFMHARSPFLVDSHDHTIDSNLANVDALRAGPESECKRRSENADSQDCKN